MARKRVTSDGEPYSDADEAAIADALEAAMADEAEEAAPAPGGATIDVEAQIEWAGTIDRNGRDGVRRTRLERIDLAEVRQATAELRRARREGPEGGYRSYRARGWRAQLRQLQRTRRGRAAIEAAGLNPATIHRWQTGRQQPSAASRARLADTYGQVANPRAAAERDAQRRVAEQFTDALRDAYGVNIRVRGIRHLRIEE